VARPAGYSLTFKLRTFRSIGQPASDLTRRAEGMCDAQDSFQGFKLSLKLPTGFLTRPGRPSPSRGFAGSTDAAAVEPDCPGLVRNGTALYSERRGGVRSSLRGLPQKDTPPRDGQRS
jgi:hypothetical protein